MGAADRPDPLLDRMPGSDELEREGGERIGTGGRYQAGERVVLIVGDREHLHCGGQVA